MIYRLFLACCLFIAAPAWPRSDWQPITQQCSTVSGDTLIMECQSAGLASNTRYSGAIHVSVEVQAQPIGSTLAYWAGLALNSNVQADDSYAEVALTKGIEPFNSLTQPSAVLLSTTGKQDCCQVMQAIDSAQWHTLSIDYANGRATYTIDGRNTVVRVRLGLSYQIELLCVAENPGANVLGALTRCQWRNLRIMQCLITAHSRARPPTSSI